MGKLTGYLLILLLLLGMTSLSVQGATVLQGGVEKTVSIDDARRAALENLEMVMPVSAYARLDSDMMTHFKAKIDKKMCFPDKRITYFSSGVYGVHPYGAVTALYYRSDGQLDKVAKATKPFLRDLDKPADYYPFRLAMYNYPGGQLDFVAVYISKLEAFCFSPTGEMISYCKADVCYDSQMKVIAFREEGKDCDKPIKAQD